MPSGAKVLVISTDPGVSSVDARVAGFNEKAAELGYVLVSETQYSTTPPRPRPRSISAALAADPDLAGVFATNLFTAQGTATGAKQAGGDQLKIVGFDAGPDQVKQLEAGDVQALVAQKPYTSGTRASCRPCRPQRRRDHRADIQTPSSVVTADNIGRSRRRQVPLQVRLRQLSHSRWVRPCT